MKDNGILNIFKDTRDYILLGLLVIFVTIQPYFMHGAINFHESGLYLPCIDALFRGEVPYRDIFILRGPFEIYMPFSLMYLFGRNVMVLRAYFYIGTVLTLIIAVFLGKQLYRLKYFSYFMALVLTANTFARVNFANWGGIRFGLGLLVLLLTIIFLKRGRFLWIFLAGIISGFSLFVSFEIGLFSAVSVIITLILYSMSGFSRMKYKEVTVFIIGCGVIVVPYVIYCFMNKALLPYFNTVFEIVSVGNSIFDVPSVQGTPRNLKEFFAALSPFNHNIKYMQPFFLYVSVSIYFLWKIFKTKLFSKKDMMVICVSIYGVFMYYGAFRDLEGPQFQMALQPAVIILYVFLEKFFIFFKDKKYNLQMEKLKKYTIYGVLCIIPVFSIVYPLQRYKKRFFIIKYAKEFFLEKKGSTVILPEDSSDILTFARANGIIVPDWQAVELRGVIEYIRANTDPWEIVFTYPDGGTYNFLADRPALGRFKSAMFSWMKPEWHRELIDEFKAKKPRYIIYIIKYPQIGPYLPKVELYRKEMSGYIEKNYRIVRNFGNINIYKIND